MDGGECEEMSDVRAEGKGFTAVMVNEKVSRKALMELGSLHRA